MCKDKKKKKEENKNGEGITKEAWNKIRKRETETRGRGGGRKMNRGEHGGIDREGRVGDAE